VSGRPAPDVLEVYVGSFCSPSYGLWWDGRQLVYESFISGYEERRQTFIAPSDAQWTKFWRTMDAIDIWSWRERYAPGARFEPTAQIRDGTHWSLSLQRGARSVESAGDSAGPGATDLDESAQFAAFAKAVSRLTGGYAFG
jgi:hypothetical protein